MKKLSECLDWKLCYVSNHIAWFAPTLDIGADDWNDAPYQYNASEPYSWKDQEGNYQTDFFMLAYYGVFETPAEIGYSISVDKLNNRVMAWLTDGKTPIYGGDSVVDFILALQGAGATVFVPLFPIGARDWKKEHDEVSSKAQA